jgi:hypothetical protein
MARFIGETLIANITDGLNAEQWNNLNNLAQLINPLTGRNMPLQDILNALVGIQPHPVTYNQLATKGLTYGAVAALNASYYDVIYKGELIFGI